MCLLGFSTFLGQNSVVPQFGGGGAEGSKLFFTFFEMFQNYLKKFNFDKILVEMSLTHLFQDIWTTFSDFPFLLFFPVVLKYLNFKRSTSFFLISYSSKKSVEVKKRRLMTSMLEVVYNTSISIEMFLNLIFSLKLG